MPIHPTALVDPKAELATDIEIGAFSVIGPNVQIGAGNKIASHAVIDGHTTIGCNNVIHSFCSLGSAPQDKKYNGESTCLEIGNGNTFFQGITISLGTVQDVGVTRIGDDNWLMAYVHIAHDCQVGSHTIFANAVTLGGHVHVGDYAILGGLTAIHQFCIVGEHVMAGGGSIIVQDVPPFVMTSGNHASASGVNSEGLRRRGFSNDAIKAIKQAYRILYRQGMSYDEAKAAILANLDKYPELQPFSDFFQQSSRGIIR